MVGKNGVVCAESVSLPRSTQRQGNAGRATWNTGPYWVRNIGWGAGRRARDSSHHRQIRLRHRGPWVTCTASTAKERRGGLGRATCGETGFLLVKKATTFHHWSWMESSSSGSATAPATPRKKETPREDCLSCPRPGDRTRVVDLPRAATARLRGMGEGQTPAHRRFRR